MLIMDIFGALNQTTYSQLSYIIINMSLIFSETNEFRLALFLKSIKLNLFNFDKCKAKILTISVIFQNEYMISKLCFS